MKGVSGIMKESVDAVKQSHDNQMKIINLIYQLLKEKNQKDENKIQRLEK